MSVMLNQPHAEHLRQQARVEAARAARLEAQARDAILAGERVTAVNVLRRAREAAQNAAQLNAKAREIESGASSSAAIDHEHHQGDHS